MGRELPGTLLFEAPTLGKLVAALEGGATAAPAPSPVATGLLPSQRTFVVQRRFFPDVPGNVFLAVTVTPPLAPDVVRERLAALARRHVALRSAIAGDRMVAGEPPSLEVGPFDEDAARVATFELERGPLLRVWLDGGRVALSAHHAAVDAWSLKNVLEGLLTGRVPDGPDWPEAAALLAGRSADYRARFADGVPPLPLPTVRAGPRMAHTTHPVAPLEARARRLGVTLPALVLAAYVRKLWRRTGQHDVVVRVAHARRDLRLPGVEHVVGSFADSLPLRVLACDDLDVLAPRVHAALRELPDAPSTELAGLARGGAPTGLSPAGFSFPNLAIDAGGHALADVRAAAANGFTGLGLVCWVHDGELSCSWNTLGLDPAPFFDLFAEPEPLPATLHGRILRRCRLHPEREAAPGLTYGQLDRRSAALARTLHGERVAIRMRPSAGALVAVLAVLRSGAAYVPLDPDWPEARIAQVLAASGAARVIDDVGDDEADDGPDVAGGLAWVMFTSGSTGAPKGVEVSHAAALVFLDWVRNMLDVGDGDRFVWTSSLGFGGSIRQMFAPLLAGAVTLPAPGLMRDPDAAVRFLRERRVTVWNAVPSTSMRLLDALERTGLDLPDCRWVLMGGEAVPAAHANRWLGRGPRVANLYGSTETVVNATWFEVTRPVEGALCPIGRARAGVTVELDGDEIVVRGAIAEGYLGGPRFGGVYRTGDLGRRLPDGNLVYLGRRDSQVQVHGNRVEMGEIEAVLCEHPAVRHAAVRLEDGRLVATVEGSADGVRDWLATRLPAYMVPARIHATDALARTPAGKIARASPLAEIWRRVLKLDRAPGPEDDFFALGGDSIALLDVLDALRDAGLPTPAATEAYRARRLGEMEALIARHPPTPPPAARGEGSRGVGSLSPRGGERVAEGRVRGLVEHPLLRAQLHFLLLHRLDPAHPPLWTARVPIRGPLDLPRFRAAFDALLARHASLRVGFDPAPRVSGAIALQYDDLAPLPDPASALDARWVEERDVRLPLEGPLVRARLCRLAAGEHVLLLTVHHAIADAWSGWVLAGELLALYDGAPLPPLEPLPAEPAPDAAWWARHLDGVEPREGTPGQDEVTVRVPYAPFTRVLRAVFESLHALGLGDDLVVSTASSGRDSRRSRAVGPLAQGVPVRARAPFLDVDARVAEALAHAPAAAPPSMLPTLGRFFLSWMDPSAVPAPPSSLALDLAGARLRFATHATRTEGMVGAVVDGDALVLHVTGGPLARPLAEELRARLGEPDAALVIYAPAGTPLPIDRPVAVERVACALGTSELVLLPVPADRLAEADLSAIPGATRARVVALAGMLPATFGLGARPLWGEGPTLTTGHAATVVAMAMTVEAALAHVGRRWADADVGCLGYGSIGKAVLALLVDRHGEPRSVRVRDPAVRMDGLDACDLVLGATSGGPGLDVAALRPGVVVVDDSFPRCFDDAAAIARMERDGDVLLTGGGMLDAGPLRRDSPFPEAAALRERYGAQWLPGCHAEALLVAADPSLGPTIGPVTVERAKRMWAAVEAAGWKAAPFHLGGWELR
ncbi:MAG: AMP-binding protein [Myxococcota bacterium]